MIEKTVIINNSTGFHARPASLFVKLIKQFDDCVITLKAGEKTANPKSVLNLLALGLSKGSELTICVDGKNEEKVVDEIVDFVANLED